MSDKQTRLIIEAHADATMPGVTLDQAVFQYGRGSRNRRISLLKKARRQLAAVRRSIDAALEALE